MSIIENKQPIPARLYNAAKGGHVAGAIDIIDDILNKTQDTINQETVGSGNGSLKEQVAAIEVITHIGDIDVQLTTSPDDIVTTGEGASKLPLSVAIAGKLFLYYTKNEIDSIVEIINGNISSKASSEALAAEMQLRREGDAALLGTDEDTAEVNSIKGLRAAILALLGTNDDSDETDTIKGLRAAINLIKQEIENLPHGGGGDTPIPTPTPSCDCMPHVVLTESEYEALQIYDNNTIYLVTEDEEWGFGDDFPIVLI